MPTWMGCTSATCSSRFSCGFFPDLRSRAGHLYHFGDAAVPGAQQEEDGVLLRRGRARVGVADDHGAGDHAFQGAGGDFAGRVQGVCRRGDAAESRGGGEPARDARTSSISTWARTRRNAAATSWIGWWSSRRKSWRRRAKQSGADSGTVCLPAAPAGAAGRQTVPPPGVRWLGRRFPHGRHDTPHPRGLAWRRVEPRREKAASCRRTPNGCPTGMNTV